MDSDSIDATQLLDRWKSLGLDTICRAPGRVNLLGQHIDHQGGFINPIAIDRAIYVGVRRRDDSLLVCREEDPRYPPYTLDLRELIPRVQGRTWEEALGLSLVETLPGARESWARYAVGVVAYMANHGLWSGEGGLDLHVAGDVPPAAGLSSSSALVVGVMLALARLLSLPLTPEQLVTLAGDAEHFVGTRGGSGDHAAILLSRNDCVSHFGFHPFRVVRQAPFPEGYRVLVCHSGFGAEKSAGAREAFNRRVMAYHLGRLWLRDQLPANRRGAISSLRDFLPTTHDELVRLYEYLAKLPERIQVAELRDQFATEEAAPYLEPLHDGETMDLRGVCLFGLAEMARAREFIDALETTRMERVFEIMYLSHDGDRVVTHDLSAGTQLPFRNNYSDLRMAALARAAKEPGDPGLAAALWRQPGRYYSSTEFLDRLIDLVQSCTPRAGAHLAGAGLGGAIVVFCHMDDIPSIRETLAHRYYTPLGLEPMIYEFLPQEGATVIHPHGSAPMDYTK